MKRQEPPIYQFKDDSRRADKRGERRQRRRATIYVPPTEDVLRRLIGKADIPGPAQDILVQIALEVGDVAKSLADENARLLAENDRFYDALEKGLAFLLLNEGVDARQAIEKALGR